MSTRMSTRRVLHHQISWRITEGYPEVLFRRNLHPVWVSCLSGKLGSTRSHSPWVRVKQALFQLSYDPELFKRISLPGLTGKAVLPARQSVPDRDESIFAELTDSGERRLCCETHWPAPTRLYIRRDGLNASGEIVGFYEAHELVHGFLFR